jgi:hypothetical protein
MANSSGDDTVRTPFDDEPVRDAEGTTRPSRFTKEVTDKILSELRLGMFFETACAMAAVPSRAARQWLTWGKEGKPKYAEFADAVEAAREEAIRRHLAIIAHAGKKDWKARAWILEKLDPKRFQPSIRVHVSELLDEALERLQAGLAPDVFEQVVAILGTTPGASAAAIGADQAREAATNAGLLPPAGGTGTGTGT